MGRWIGCRWGGVLRESEDQPGLPGWTPHKALGVTSFSKFPRLDCPAQKYEKNMKMFAVCLVFLINFGTKEGEGLQTDVAKSLRPVWPAVCSG